MGALKMLMRISLCIGAFSLFTGPCVAEEPMDECSKDLLLSYFPEPFVIQTLKQFNIPEEAHQMIAKELQEKDKEVVRLVEMKAERMDPNPLRDPRHRQEAVKLFRETLFELFSSVLNKYQVTDKAKIQAMLDEIQRQKAEQFARCMERHQPQEMEMKEERVEFGPSEEEEMIEYEY